MTYIKGIKFRLTALFVALYGFTLIVFSGFLYNVFVSNQQREFDATLFNYTIDITGSLKMDVFGSTFLSANFNLEREKILPFNIGKTFIKIRDPQGKVISRSPNAVSISFPFDPDTIGKHLLEGPYYQTLVIDADHNPQTKPNTYRMVTVPIQNPALPQLYIQVAAPMDLIKTERTGMATFFVLSIPLVLVIAGIIGFFFSRKAIQPVDVITHKAQDISAGNLSERIPVPETKDELYDLATTLNELLTRLENAFQSQEQFVADASHQLKTPLAIMRGEIDVLKTKVQLAPEVRSFLESASQEVNAMTRIITNLLLLARATAGSEEFLKSRVRLDEIILNQMSQMEKLAKKKDIRLRINLNADEASKFEVRGNEELLGCLFQNLLENSIKYSPAKSTVDIHLNCHGKLIEASIKDQGPGIPDKEKKKIFEPFFRSAQTSYTTEGAGLGLSLAKKVAEVHDATLLFKNLDPGPGAHFTLQIKNI